MVREVEVRRDFGTFNSQISRFGGRGVGRGRDIILGEGVFWFFEMLKGLCGLG